MRRKLVPMNQREITSYSDVENYLLEELPEKLLLKFATVTKVEQNFILYAELLTNFVNDKNIEFIKSCIDEQCFTHPDKFEYSYNLIYNRYFEYRVFEPSVSELLDYIDSKSTSSYSILKFDTTLLIPGGLCVYEDNLYDLLKKDDVDTLGKLLAEVQSPRKDLLNLSALYGSLKCFKLLLLSGFSPDDETLICAVHGCNYEIIHILEQKGEAFHADHLVVAIFCHHWELVSYIMTIMNLEFDVMCRGSAFVKIVSADHHDFTIRDRLPVPPGYDIDSAISRDMKVMAPILCDG